MKIVITGGSSGIGKAILNLAKSKGYITYNFDKTEGLDITTRIRSSVRPDILINCAGITDKGSIRSKNIVKQTRKIMEVNFYGTLNVIQWALKRMKRGVIINIGSKSAYKPMKNRLAYSVSKGALLTLTKQLAVELAPNIRVNSISPGTIDTNMPNSIVKGICKPNNLVKRKGTPEEVAKLVLDIAENKYITGQDFIIDGGYLLM